MTTDIAVTSPSRQAIAAENRSLPNRVTGRLHHAITDAVALGVFGVPSFVLDGEVYWGNDRLILLRWALTGQR